MVRYRRRERKEERENKKKIKNTYKRVDTEREKGGKKEINVG